MALPSLDPRLGAGLLALWASAGCGLVTPPMRPYSPSDRAPCEAYAARVRSPVDAKRLKDREKDDSPQTSTLYCSVAVEKSTGPKEKIVCVFERTRDADAAAERWKILSEDPQIAALPHLQQREFLFWCGPSTTDPARQAAIGAVLEQFPDIVEAARTTAAHYAPPAPSGAPSAPR